jgi:hypothetical protein
MPATSDTQLSIKQTLDTDPEINFIPWELNIQDVAATKARNLHPRGLLSLVLNQHQWDTHAFKYQHCRRTSCDCEPIRPP